MTRNIIIGIVVFLFLIIAGSIIQLALQPKPFAWNPTYYNFDKQPYGSFILYSQLKNIFPGKIVKRLKDEDLDNYLVSMDFSEATESLNIVVDSTYLDYGEDDFEYEISEEDTLLQIQFEDSIPNKSFNFLFLNSAFTGSETKIKTILQHIYQGNRALIASGYLSYQIENFFDLKMIQNEVSNNHSDSARNAFKLYYRGDFIKAFKPEDYYSYFDSYPENAEIIARNEYDQVIGLKVPLGKGEITFFSIPIIFTNYYLLKEDRELVESLLTELPLEDTYWAQSLLGPFSINYPENRSILVFIHSNESLTWAFYTLLFTLLIFFLFQVKRRQRIIPVMSPPENTSIKFLQVLGNLYLNKKDHKDMLMKKMNYFLMWVRDEMNIDTSKINEEFMLRLSHKSKVKLGVIKLLFERYNRSIRQPMVTAEDYILVNKLFQDFKQTDNERKYTK